MTERLTSFRRRYNPTLEGGMSKGRYPRTITAFYWIFLRREPDCTSTQLPVAVLERERGSIRVGRGDSFLVLMNRPREVIVPTIDKPFEQVSPILSLCFPYRTRRYFGLNRSHKKTKTKTNLGFGREGRCWRYIQGTSAPETTFGLRLIISTRVSLTGCLVW